MTLLDDTETPEPTLVFHRNNFQRTFHERALLRSARGLATISVALVVVGLSLAALSGERLWGGDEHPMHPALVVVGMLVILLGSALMGMASRDYREAGERWRAFAVFAWLLLIPAFACAVLVVGQVDLPSIATNARIPGLG